MTYRQDPKRKAAAKWHTLLNNGLHFAAVDSTGRVIATGATRYSSTLTAAMRYRPGLTLIRIDDQI